MTEERRQELQTEAKHLKSMWDALSVRANEAHESGDYSKAWSLLAKKCGILAEEARITHELCKGVL